jgi:hypothetical protein
MRIFFCLLTFISVASVSAQQSYLTAGVGYGFYIADGASGGLRAYTDYDDDGTLAKGMAYGFNIGHLVNGKTGIDLGIWYVAGSSFQTKRYDSAGAVVPCRFNGNTLRIMPAFKTSWGQKNKLYIKLGLVLGIATNATIEDEYTINNICVTSPYIVTHKFSGGTSSGWFGTFGINYSADEKTSFFVEANYVKQHYEPIQETIDACEAETITYQLVDKPNPHNPDEKPKPTFPFNSIGINAGVKILLGTKAKDTAPVPAQ